MSKHAMRRIGQEVIFEGFEEIVTCTLSVANEGGRIYIQPGCHDFMDIVVEIEDGVCRDSRLLEYFEQTCNGADAISFTLVSRHEDNIPEYNFYVQERKGG